MPRLKLVRTSAFRLTLLYVALFCASVLALLGFLYWSTVKVINRQTAETIEAEVRGLAEQYKEQGLFRLIDVIRERSDEAGNRDSVYLLTDPLLNPLAGNLTAWPEKANRDQAWIRLTLNKRDQEQLVPHEIRARIFTLTGGYRLLVGRDTYEKTRLRAIVIEALAWSVAATLALGLIGGVFMSRRMLARVEGMARTTRQIMEGDLSHRIEKTGTGDEFDRLAGSLNAMLDQIERLMTGMRLATDSIAHDLRGPLTRLRGSIELALRRPPDAVQDREALAAALAQTDTALVTFDSLLKIAMAEAGVDAAELKALSLAAVARDVAELYAPVAEEQGIALVVEVDESATIRAQPELLAQAVANLLDNAVRHTPAGGRIAVSVVASSESVSLRVADTGPGIPEADRERVIERFVRLEEARSGPGAGLGLSLVAAVAKLHGATLRLDDNNPGLQVTLQFPPWNGSSSSNQEETRKHPRILEGAR